MQSETTTLEEIRDIYEQYKEALKRGEKLLKEYSERYHPGLNAEYMSLMNTLLEIQAEIVMSMTIIRKEALSRYKVILV